MSLLKSNSISRIKQIPILSQSIRQYTDRSFRLANVSDLAVAQEMKNKISIANEHYFAGFKQTSKIQGRRDPTKQIVIDLSHEQGYRRGHVKGAINLPLETFDFTKKVDMWGGIHKDEVLQTMKQLGISDETSEIILYDNSGLLACRLYYVLRYFGFINVRILNGGWRAWIRSGFPVDETYYTLPPSKNLSLKPIRNTILKKNSQMLVDVKNQTSIIIDTRRPDAFRKVSIDGAINIPVENFMEDGMFKDVESVRKMLDNKKIDIEGKPVTLYSSRGLTACVGYFSLTMAGFEHVSVYDGGIYSWLQNGEETLSQEARDFLSGN